MKGGAVQWIKTEKADIYRLIPGVCPYKMRSHNLPNYIILQNGRESKPFSQFYARIYDFLGHRAII